MYAGAAGDMATAGAAAAAPAGAVKPGDPGIAGAQFNVNDIIILSRSVCLLVGVFVLRSYFHAFVMAL